MKTVLICLFSLALVEASAETPNVMLTGRQWNALSPQARVGYIAGVEQATQLTIAEFAYFKVIPDSAAVKLIGQKVIRKFSPVEILEQLDAFFSDTANSNVFVIVAYQDYVKSKLEGATEVELQSRAAKLRRDAHTQTRDDQRSALPRTIK